MSIGGARLPWCPLGAGPDVNVTHLFDSPSAKGFRNTKQRDVLNCHLQENATLDQLQTKLTSFGRTIVRLPVEQNYIEVKIQHRLRRLQSELALFDSAATRYTCQMN